MSDKKIKTIALVGNPNSGKSSIFNQLTGLRQKVGNFPGVTVDKKIGSLQLENGSKVKVIDLPGTYSLHPTSQDERVVLNVLTNPNDANYPDAIVYVADSTNLEKHFLLFTQVLDLGFPSILALNMTDIVEKEAIEIDVQKLTKHLGIPVVQVSGRSGNNLTALLNAIPLLNNQQRNSSTLNLSKIEQQLASKVQQSLKLHNDYQALLLTYHHPHLSFLKKEQKEALQGICEEASINPLRLQIDETMRRYNAFTPLLQNTIHKPIRPVQTLTDRFDAVFTHKIFGPAIFILAMLLVFQAIFAWATYPMDWIEAGFGMLTEAVQNTLPENWFTSLLTDGILAGLGGILVFIPQIAILFFLISILEEVGYMARAVFIFDKLMQKFGLNGRSIVALISGGACAIPAIMSARTIGNWKERLITILVTPFISCSARIPVYTVLIGFVVPPATVWGIFNLQGVAFMGLYLLGIFTALIAAYIFKKILHSNETSFLMLELPEYRMPVWKNILLNVKEKVGAFVLEAGKIIFIISIVLWFLASYGPNQQIVLAEQEAITLAQQQSLNDAETADLIASKKIEASFAGHLGKFIEPAITPLGYDWKIGIALITSFAAREVFVGTMATIYSIGSADDEATVREHLAKAKNPKTGLPVYTLATSLSLLIFYVFAMQCMSTVAVVKRETGGWKWAIIQFVFMSGLAYLGAFFTYQILS